MLAQQQTINWKSVVWAGLLIFVIPTLLSFLVPAVVGTVTGFTSRGDMDMVNARVQALTSSLGFAIFFFACFAIVGLWRGSILARKTGYQIVLHVGIAAVVAALFSLLITLFMSGGNFMGSLSNAAIVALAAFAGGYAGALLVSRR